MSKCKRIFIIGHPGAGKAVLAKAIAEKLGWQFIDADIGLESRIGCELTDILGKQGEKAFLNCQYHILANLLNKDNIVVTTDVAIVRHEEIKDLLAGECIVYLRVSTPIQLERLSRSAESLLPIKDQTVFFDALHEKSDDLFEELANITIQGDDGALDKHVSIVLEKMQMSSNNAMKEDIHINKSDVILFHKSQHTPVRLTVQQAKILKLLSQGKSAKEIAKELQISYRTVEGSIAKLQEKLGCDSSKELIVLYHDQP